MYVYTDKNLIDLIPPKACSVVFGGFGDVKDEYIAEYDKDALPEDDAWYEANPNVWWREVGRANTSVPFNLSGIVEAGGLLEYLCDGDPQRVQYDDDDNETVNEEAWEGGASTEKNVAACIGEMARDAGMDPIAMVNAIDAEMRSK
jgi:hypothetical protein